MTSKCKVHEFYTYETAEEYAEAIGGDAMTLPGPRFFAVSARNCERIERAGGPATCQVIGNRPHGGTQTIRFGR